MPELPEVETIRRQLAPHLEGRRIERMEILDARWTRPHDPRGVEEQLQGALIRRVGRAGKYLDLVLSGGRHLLVHLRMTGSLLFDPAQEPAHTRARFHLDGDRRLLYVDPRRFGTGHLLGLTEREAYLGARLGAEPFTPGFTVRYLRQAARGRRAPVKAFLLDQRRIAGVGNIYADESLHRARLRPDRVASTVSKKSAQRLHESLRASLQTAIENRGSSVDTYRDAWGEIGGQQEKLLVYGRAGEPCFTCGRPLSVIRIAGRTTVFCRHCQH